MKKSFEIIIGAICIYYTLRTTSRGLWTTTQTTLNQTPRHLMEFNAFEEDTDWPTDDGNYRGSW